MIEARYIAHSGDDLLVVNAARVSFAKTSEWDLVEVDRPESPFVEVRDVLSARDAKLIDYLARHQHWTPFAHPQITLHVKAPVFVRTQCFKHKVGFTENEISRRYVDGPPILFEPEHWRLRAEDKKQGSSDEILHMEEGRWKEHPGYYVAQFYMQALDVYERLLGDGVAPEQARMVLPQAMMTEWYWTGSLAAWARFYRLRAAGDAQKETCDLALACGALIAPLFPVSWKALTP